MVNAAPQLRFSGLAPAAPQGLYLIPGGDEPDVFDDADIAPEAYVPPTYYTPDMITDNVIDFHPYQRDAIAAALNAILFEPTRSMRLIMPTGTGKTITFNAIAKMIAALDLKVLILVHRKDLLRQADEKLQKVGIVPLIEQGNSHARRPFLDGERRVVVASVGSMHMERLQMWPRDAFDLVISDECHHVRADNKNHWWKVSKWFKSAFHFGVTATPGVTKSIKGKKRYINIPGWECDIEPIKMLDAIEQGYLAPLVFRQVKTDIDLRAVGRVFGEDSDFQQNELDAVIHKNTNRLATAIKENIEQRPTIAFTPLVASAGALADALNDIGVSAAMVSGETADPLAVYNAHERGEFQVLVNCMKCTEGFDAPYIEAVVLARPTQSVNVYRQCVGRGTRTFTNKKTGYVKKNCLVVDFAFITGNLPLVGGAAILRDRIEQENPEDVDLIFEVADDLIKNGFDLELLDALDQARLTVEEIKEKQRIREEIEAREAERREARRLKNQEERFRYEVTTLDPFSVNLLGIPQQQMDGWGNGSPITEAQANLIERMTKGKIKTAGLTASAASAIIGQLRGDAEAGRPTFAQCRVLTKSMGAHNLTPEQARAMTKQEASAYIDQYKTW